MVYQGRHVVILTNICRRQPAFAAAPPASLTGSLDSEQGNFTSHDFDTVGGKYICKDVLVYDMLIIINDKTADLT